MTPMDAVQPWGKAHALTHDRADKAQHDQTTVYDDRADADEYAAQDAHQREAHGGALDTRGCAVCSAFDQTDEGTLPGWTCDECEPGEYVNDPDETKWSAVREAVEKAGFVMSIAHAGGGFAGVHLTRPSSQRVAMLYDAPEQDPDGFEVQFYADANAHGHGAILFTATLAIYNETSTTDELAEAILALWDADPETILPNGHRRYCARMGDLPDSDRDSACNCDENKRWWKERRVRYPDEDITL